jgi:RES domain-containing protein
VHKDFAANAFSGEGARRAGGRWNPPGTAAIYASESLALAVFEVFVHVQDWALLREQFRWFRGHVPGMVENAVLPKRWKDAESATRAAGSEFLAAKKRLALRIPSAILPDSRNLLLSPHHPDFAKVAWDGPFELELDSRL